MDQSVPSHAFAQRDVAWLIDTQAKQRGEKNFLIWEPVDGDPQTWTFASYAAETRAYAAGLHARGVHEGQCVAIYLDNCPEFLILWGALTRLGAIAVLINTRSTLDELTYFFRDSKAVGIITQPKYFELASKAAKHQQWITCTHTDAGAERALELPSANSLETLRTHAATPVISSPRTMAPATVIYTSGTTARPKGVVWTHANALWIASTTALHYQLTPADVHPIYLPLFHSNGLGLSFLSTLWSGGTIVLTPKFSASRFWEVAVRHQCTWAQMFWFALRAMTDQQDPPAHNFRFWAALGDMGSVRERWGIKTVGIYGMTETVGLCVSSDLHIASAEKSMGRVRPEWQLELRRDDGSRASIGETGQIWV
ncbi:MAG TPA: AMP-binding protein, partial [Verrucomicrobiae bacterium]|nr:AMP-binding protein [Verrucomicrobiae bacterium]